MQEPEGRPSGRTPALALALAIASAGTALAAEATVAIRLDRKGERVSPLICGCSLPAPGTPGARSILREIVRNRSFETPPPGKPLPMPRAWRKPPGWELVSCGAMRRIVRRTVDGKDPLVVVRRARWGDYQISLFARKIDGPGGFAILFEVENSGRHLRWVLGGKGNRYHLLQRLGGGRVREITTPVVGRIDAGRCYKIDISVRGRTVRCSLDGRLIHRVDNAALRFAGFGFAPADATAEYFSVRVESPKLRELYALDHRAEGRRETIAAGWEALRDPRNEVLYRWDTLYPANSYFSQRIEVNQYVGGDAGIRQRGVPIQAGSTYKARLHLRANEPVSVVVSLRGTNGKVYASRRAAKLTEPWRAYELALKPAASDPAAELCIAIEGQARAWVDQVSLQRSEDGATYGLRSNLVAALRALRPAALRWPAGPAAMHYRWRRGVGPPDARAVAAVTDGRRPAFEAALNDFGTDEFLALCRDVGAEPILVLNAAPGMRHALYWLDYCNGPVTTPMGKLRAANGHPKPYHVKYWAIGRAARDQMTAGQYAFTVAKIAQAMREQDSSVRLVAFGGPGTARTELDDALAKEAGPHLSHLARGARLGPVKAEGVSSFEDLAAGLRALRSTGRAVALTDWSPAPSPLGPALTASTVLSILAREGGPHAIATAADAATPPAYNVLKLFRANQIRQLVGVELQRPPGHKALPLGIVAGRSGERVVLWLTHCGERAAAVRIVVQGAGERRLGRRADVFRISGAAAPENTKTELADGQLSLSLRPRSIYAVVIPLEGG